MTQPEETLKELSLVGHLRELRKRIIYSILWILIGAGISWFFRIELFDLIRAPIEPFLNSPNKGLLNLGLTEMFFAYIRISILGGIILSCPFWLFHLWRFIAPALYKHEKRYALGFIFSGTVLFCSGVAFAYYVVYPIAFPFFLSFVDDKDQTLIQISSYLKIFTTSALGLGLAFELPLVLVILGLMGVVTSDFLAQNRRYAFLLLCFSSAVLTPPDPMSMLLMAGPLAFLYEGAIWTIRLMVKNEK